MSSLGKQWERFLKESIGSFAREKGSYFGVMLEMRALIYLGQNSRLPRRRELRGVAAFKLADILHIAIQNGKI